MAISFNTVAAMLLGAAAAGLAQAEGAVVQADRATATDVEAVAAGAKVRVRGTVADDATKSQILARLRELYGTDRIVDELAVANVLTPPNWAGNLQKLLVPGLGDIHHGELSVNGTEVSVRGEVGSELRRQQLVSDMATQLNPTYVIRNGLRAGSSPQAVLDATLANRTIEFESASAVLTDRGRAILDEMLAALKSVGSPRLELIGHTDATGLPEQNLLLSQARAISVKRYLAASGLDATLIAARGVGAAAPLTSNATPEGRARNRRIEFRVVQP